jgi:glycosyltransferase involved in cell wall biosynthesis
MATNIALVYNDSPRFWTVGSYIEKVLANQNEISLVGHPRIPEDTGVLEQQCGLDLDLVIVIDCSVHYKTHHHRGKLLPKTRTCIWLSDLHRSDWAVWRLQMIREWHYNHVFYCQKNFKEMIINCGYSENEISFLPHAADPEIFKPLPYISKKFDIGYIGYSNSKRQRAETILKEYMNFKHFDSVWAWTANRCMQELKIGFNISVEQDINMRIFETMAAGIPLLTNYIPDNGMEDLFGKDLEDKMLVYNNELEMKEKAVRLLANPDLRKTLSENARQHVLQYHTYRNRINTLLGTMGFELLKNYE